MSCHTSQGSLASSLSWATEGMWLSPVPSPWRTATRLNDVMALGLVPSLLSLPLGVW